MKFVISAYKEKETFPCGFGVLENSGHDLEEKALGEITIKGYTVQASLEMLAPLEAPAANPLQTQLDIDGLQPAES